MGVNIRSLVSRSCVQGLIKLVRRKFSKKSTVHETSPPPNKDEEMEQWVRQFRVERTSMLRSMGKKFIPVPGWHSITVPCKDARPHMVVSVDHVVVGHVHYDRSQRDSRLIDVLKRGGMVKKECK